MAWGEGGARSCEGGDSQAGLGANLLVWSRCRCRARGMGEVGVKQNTPSSDTTLGSITSKC